MRLQAYLGLENRNKEFAIEQLVSHLIQDVVVPRRVQHREGQAGGEELVGADTVVVHR